MGGWPDWTGSARAMTGTTCIQEHALEAAVSETHLALFYGDADEYLDGVMRFVAPALEAGEPVVIAVPGPNVELLRAQLEGHAAEVEMFDMFEFGRNPSRIIPAVEGMLARHQGRHLHYVGEPIWAGRSAEEIREATKHEALINLAWPGAGIRALCPYDAASLDPQVLADAERTHPHLIRGDETVRSAAYEGPVVPVGCQQPLSQPPAEALCLAFALDDLAIVRSLVSRQADAAGLAPDRASDLVLAVDELATNTIVHANGSGVVRAWSLADQVVCQVEDRGEIDDPLAGRRLPVIEEGGIGLWMVNQLCDLVEVRTGPERTTVRVHVTLD